MVEFKKEINGINITFRTTYGSREPLKEGAAKKVWDVFAPLTTSDGRLVPIGRSAIAFDVKDALKSAEELANLEAKVRNKNASL